MKTLAALLVVAVFVRADSPSRFQALGTNFSVGQAEDEVTGLGSR